MTTLPTRTRCDRLHAEFHTPGNILAHCKEVNRVAVTIAQNLAESGFDIDIELVDRASRLHDLFKFMDFPGDVTNPLWLKYRNKFKNMGHEEAAYTFFHKKYPKMASLIRHHGYKEIDKLSSWEEKILYYADKRVMHDRAVSLSKRLEDGHRRYRKTHGESTVNVDAKIQALEKEIFYNLAITPQSLNSTGETSYSWKTTHKLD